MHSKRISRHQVSNRDRKTPPARRRSIAFLIALLSIAYTGAQRSEKMGIQKVSPTQQRVNEIITLTGTGFGAYDPLQCAVMLGNKKNSAAALEAQDVYVWKDNMVKVRVPSGWGGQQSFTENALGVWVVNAQGTTNSLPFQVILGPPSLLSLGGAGLEFEQLTDIVNDSDVSTVLGNPNLNAARTKDAEVGDVNSDGLMDLIDSNSNNTQNNTHGVLRLNNGNGGFTAIALEPNSAGDGGSFYTTVPPGGDFVGNSVIYDADLADITGDNRPDFIQGAASANRLRILINGGGGFTEDSANRLPALGNIGCPDDLDHADVDNDGDIDLIVGMRTANPQCPGNTSPNRLLLNNGGGFFTSITLSPPNGTSTHDVFFIDANRDGFQDIVLVNENGSSQLFTNNGNPGNLSFSAGATFGSAATGAVADFNGDGFQDFVLGTTIYLNNPANPGSFSSSALPGGAPGFVYDVELGDLDLNGAVDVVVVSITQNANNTVRVWLNNGNAGFTNVTSQGAGSLLPGVGPYQRLSADLIDVDDDGDLDLYITGADGQNVGQGFGAVPNQLFGNLTRDGGDSPPVAVIAPPSCSGFVCSFDGSGSFDDIGIVTYSWNFGDGTTGSGAQVTHTYSSSGTFLVTLTVTDASSQSDSAQVTVAPVCGDNTLPNVSITAPSPGDRVWGNFSIQANASDNVGVTQVRFYVAGALQCIDNGPPYSCVVNGDNFVTNHYPLTARAFDACGNSRLSGAVTVRIVSNPEAIIDFPLESEVVDGEVAIQGWATDPGGVAALDITFDGQSTILATYGTGRSDVCAAVPVNDPNCPFVGYEASFDSTGYSNGPHSIEVTATDAGGLATTMTRSFVIDNPPPPPCVPNSTTLCLRSSRFKAELIFVNNGQSGAGQAVPWSDESGIFWFFNSENLEVGVKVLGPDNDGYWWVFHGGGTDREYTLTVTDTQTGNIKTYFKPFGSFCGEGDTRAFPPDGSGGGGQLQLAMSFAGGPVGTAQLTGSCTPGPKNVCLQDSRFKVEVLRSGVLQTAVPVTDQSGTFWFFSNQNLELIVKVLGPANGQWWVFYGSLTDRDFTIRVTDTATDQIQEYFNPLGQFCGNGDTQAFPE